MPISYKLLLALFGALALSAAVNGQSDEVKPTPVDYDVMARNARETVTRFVEADTTSPPGNEARVARLVAKRLDQEGIAYEITEFAPGRENIVARIKATATPTSKPLLLLSHDDVVTAEGQTWTSDPHQVTSKDGYLVARGIADDLGMGAIDLEVFIALKKSIAPLKRDVILALTGDEESDGQDIKYLLKHKRESLDAGLALNEGGGYLLGKNGKVEQLNLAAAEKTYQDFELTAHGTTGHSSVPVKDNAIYRLSRALARLEAAPQPPRLIEVTRAYFVSRSEIEQPPLSIAMRELGRAPALGPLPPKALQVIEANPTLAALLRTTCVATTIKGGTRVNALPADAVANVNCRILPDETIVQTRVRLNQIVNAPGEPLVEITLSHDSGHGPASPIEGEAVVAIKEVTHSMWPGLPIIPSLTRGATDSRYLRQVGIPAYGINPLPLSDSDEMRMHGIDERVPVASFRSGVELMHKLVLKLSL